MKRIIIAIDGHSSCGKSTMAKHLAHELGYLYVDTGAMYRAVTLYALRRGMMDGETKHIDTEALEAALPGVEVTQTLTPAGVETRLNGEPVEGEIRQMRVSACVSPIAALPSVRRHLVACQQAMGQQGGIVMDGRDIGTVVFPQAELKVFVTASSTVRAQRRLKDLRAQGDTTTTLDDVRRNIEERDYIDSHRATSPLVQAADARVLDNSDLTLAEQNALLLTWAQEAIGIAPSPHTHAEP